jgi:chromosome segregation ATPase
VWNQCCLALGFTGGKSAILTALCVAFGCRAKGTQRASTLKDFIKTGCRFASFAFLFFYAQ